MTLEQYLKAAAALIGAIGALWAAWSKLWKTRIQPWLKARQNYHSITYNSETFNRMQFCLGRITAAFGCMAAMTLVARDGGFPWRPTDQIKVSILNEYLGPSVSSVFYRFQEWVCDPWYRSLLTQIIHSGESGVLLLARENVEGVLKDYYDDRGIAASIVFFLTVTELSEVVYVTVNFGRPRHEGEEKLPVKEAREYEQQARKLFNRKEQVRKMVLEARRAYRAPHGSTSMT